ncbi:MAG: PilZ domain-containing protein, partial [Gemmatimonadota bacterium]
MGFALKRAHYRVTYPATVRPTLDWDGGSCAVLNVSEHGLGFQTADTNRATVGAPVRGVLRFRSSHVVAVNGTLVRNADGQIGVCLNTDLPYRLIVEEQL